MIQKNINLQSFNTFNINAVAGMYANITDEKQLIELSDTKEWNDNPIFVLGGGSNLLFQNAPKGLTIHVDVDGIEIIDETDDYVLVKAGAGVVWNDLVEYALKNNLGGIENLILIPGKCGAAPMQNIGAYGVELESVFDSLSCFLINEKRFRQFDKDECQFGYRDSVFKNKLKGEAIITSITLRLTKKHELNTSYGAIQSKLEEFGIISPTIQDVAKAVKEIRQSKLPNPAVTPNAGSFFKNPIVDNSVVSKIQEQHPQVPVYKIDNSNTKIPAGWLIEQCGWKGRTVDGIGTWKHQALVIVNNGTENGKKIVEFARKIQSDVFNKFGIKLEPEVNIIG